MGPSVGGRFFRLTPKHFGKEISVSEFLDDHVGKKRIVILGEFHGAGPIIELQKLIQETLACNIIQSSLKSGKLSSVFEPKTTFCDVDVKGTSPKVRVLMEHFSMPMQGILDQYQSGELNTVGLMKAYRGVGTEGHNLIPYIPVLESACHNHYIQLYGGFIPRTFAKLLMNEGSEKAISEASRAGFLASDEKLEGTDAHYNYFESLLTGRDIHLDPDGKNATDRFRKMFPAQIIKDASMAWAARRILNLDITGHDKMLVVCGIGHMLYGHGIPERILANSNTTSEEMLRVACLPIDEKIGSNFDVKSLLNQEYGGPRSDAADICFIYKELDADFDDKNKEIHKETKEAYDKVGATAHLGGGDLIKAQSILESLRYHPGEISYLGEDAVNYQGVGCPHRHVHIKEGDVVLDMGSGLGIDSLIANRTVGPTGRVIGVDISNECVNHANRKAAERGKRKNLSFLQSSIESIGNKLPENSFDVVISNGAFCLLPDKKAGFSECFRLLKSGGSISLCTTVIKENLERGVDWPLCMQTFANIHEIEPILRELGFVDIALDLSDSLMIQEIPDLEDGTEEKRDGGKERFKIHKDGSEEYRHLENFDMNRLCARVVVKARKP